MYVLSIVSLRERFCDIFCGIGKGTLSACGEVFGTFSCVILYVSIIAIVVLIVPVFVVIGGVILSATIIAIVVLIVPFFAVIGIKSLVKRRSKGAVIERANSIIEQCGELDKMKSYLKEKKEAENKCILDNKCPEEESPLVFGDVSECESKIAKKRSSIEKSIEDLEKYTKMYPCDRGLEGIPDEFSNEEDQVSQSLCQAVECLNKVRSDFHVVTYPTPETFQGSKLSL